VGVLGLSAPLLLQRDDEEPLFSRSTPVGTALVGWGWARARGVGVLALATSPLERGAEAGAGAGAAAVSAVTADLAVLGAVAGVPLLAGVGGLLSV